MYFEVSNDAGGHPTWKLFGANHEMVAWAGESFSSPYNAQRAARAFQAAAGVAYYETKSRPDLSPDRLFQFTNTSG